MRILRTPLPAFLLLLVAAPAARAAGSAPDPASAAAAAADDHPVDEMLTRLRVRGALLEHLRGESFRVSIDVQGTAVTLSGEVKRRASRDLAETVVKTVKGVGKVDNRLTVAAAGSTPVAATVEHGEREVHDALLETRVKTRLLETVGKAAFAVEVEATDGVVSLTGVVTEPLQRELIEKTAKATPGVKELHNLLKAQ